MNQMHIVEHELLHQEYRLNRLRSDDRLYVVDTFGVYTEHIDQCNNLYSAIE